MVDFIRREIGWAECILQSCITALRCRSPVAQRHGQNHAVVMERCSASMFQEHESEPTKAADCEGFSPQDAPSQLLCSGTASRCQRSGVNDG